MEQDGRRAKAVERLVNHLEEYGVTNVDALAQMLAAALNEAALEAYRAGRRDQLQQESLCNN